MVPNEIAHFDKQRLSKQCAFTVIELVLVITIFGLIASLTVTRLDSYQYWKEQSAIRQLTETIRFLHHQAITDQQFYRIEFDFENREYSVKTFLLDDAGTASAQSSSAIGNLTQELAFFLNPSLKGGASLVAPRTLPSLAEPTALPASMFFKRIRTMRQVVTEGKAYMLLSPRGFSEFCVIHIGFDRGEQTPEITILVNPFSGSTKVIDGFKDFEWTYGNKPA